MKSVGTIRKASLFFALLLIVFFSYHGLYFPVIRKGPNIKREFHLWTPPPAPIVQGLRLHVFNTGLNQVSSLLAGNVHPWRPVPAFVIEHPQYGLLVFDCGLSSQIAQQGKKALHPITRFFFDTRSRSGEDLPSQMKKDNLLPSDVKRVIFSHLHFDHIGNAVAFSNATYYIGQGTDITHMTRMNGFEPDYIAALRKKYPFKVIDFSSGKPFATFEKAVDVFGDSSVIAIEGNGHLDGSMSLFVRLPKGMVFLAGDEAVHFHWIESDDVERIAANPDRAAEIRNRIRMLRELRPDILIFPGHDFPKVPKDRSDILIHHFHS